ncbi:MAG TPA: helix-turn-helix domain-containing protein [Trebonia sp.]|nr:helix-turn-helix domain-containing protein [Trebonia sp.]
MSVLEVPASLRTWMSAVGMIVRAVNAAEPRDAVLTLVATQACELIGFDFCAVMLPDETGERLRVAGCSGLTADYLAQVTDDGSLLIYPPGAEQDTPAARAYREDLTMVVADVRESPRYGRLRSLAPTGGYQALVASPLAGPGQPAGVLVAYSVAARDFTGPELELIELLSAQTGLALDTARLRAQQQEVIRELSQANTELRRGRALLEWAERQHHQLMQLVLDEVEIPGLVGSLAETLRASVTVEDADGRVLASAPAEGYCAPPGLAARRRGPVSAALRAHRESGRRYAVSRVPASPSAAPAAASGGEPAAHADAWAAPVVLAGELVGRLWVTALPTEPDPLELRLIERFALVIALVLLQQRQLLDVQSRLSGDLVADLLRDDSPMRTQAIIDRAAAIGHDLSQPHTVSVLAIDGPAPSAARLHQLVRAAAEPGPQPLIGAQDGLYVLLLPVGPDSGIVLRRVHDQVGQALGPRTAVTVVAGPAAHDPAHYATAFRVARGTVSLHRTSTPGGFIDVRGLGLSALLLETGVPEGLRRFAHGALHQVEKHEERHGGDLLMTLRAWLDAGCSTAGAAEALYVHRNTICYRLARIEQLLGRSLRDTGLRLELQLALMVREIASLDPPA